MEDDHPQADGTLTEPRPLLSLAMMVRDEEELLEDALRSARDWVDELVVVDTGSVDRTVEIAESLGARVEFFPWCDDFARARNETLRHARGRFVAILDADERFVVEDPTALRSFLEQLRGPTDVVGIRCVDISLDGIPSHAYQSLRFFPNDGQLAYAGRVHNRLVSTAPEETPLRVVPYDGISIHHLGYDKELWQRRKKTERSLPLIESMVEEDPENFLYLYYLGRSYLQLKRFSDAVPALQRAWTMAAGRQDIPEPLFEEMTCVTLDALHVTKAGQDRIEAIAETFGRRLGDHPDVLFRVGKGRLFADQAPDAIAPLERSVSLLMQRPTLGFSLLTQTPWIAAEYLGHACWDLQRFRDAYRAYQWAMVRKPSADDQWPLLLERLCILAMESGDQDRLTAFLDRLLANPDTNKDVFFEVVRRQIGAGDIIGAGRQLDRGKTHCPAIDEDPRFSELEASCLPSDRLR